MVSLEAYKLFELSSDYENVRNVCIISVIDYGKSTLLNSLRRVAGITVKDEQNLILNNNMEYNPRNRHSLYYKNIKVNSEWNEVLINFYTVPSMVDNTTYDRHYDMSDGMLILVDCVEGYGSAYYSTLQRAFNAHLKPTLALNKLDRFFFELQLEPEEMYQYLSRHIDQSNMIMQMQEQSNSEWELSPLHGNVAFISGKQGWGFTIQSFAKLYAHKFGIPEEKLVQKFWGDHYFDVQTKKWTTFPISASGAKLTRAFCQFIIQPIYSLIQAVNDRQRLDRMISMLGVNLNQEERNLQGIDLLKVILAKWMPLSECVLKMMVTHLPPPYQKSTLLAS